VRVPLLVRGPDVKPGRISRLTSNIDLTPTILEWAEVEVPANFVDGRSFARRLRGQVDRTDDPQEVLLHGCLTGKDSDRSCGAAPEHMGKAWAVRTDRYKYIEYEDGSTQLFDLHGDPWELTNLVTDADHTNVVNECSTTIARLRRGGPRVSTAGTTRSAPAARAPLENATPAAYHPASGTPPQRARHYIRHVRRRVLAAEAFTAGAIVGALVAAMLRSIRRDARQHTRTKSL
jgi:hypothetical protein